MVKSYLAIEQVRLGSRLAVDCTASEEALYGLVPALILQPLVENAVVHGIANLLEGGTISVKGEHHQSTLLLQVSNPCDPDRPKGKRAGVGLSLVRERLQSLYGAAAQLRIQEERNHYAIEVVIPFTTTEVALNVESPDDE